MFKNLSRRLLRKSGLGRESQRSLLDYWGDDDRSYPGTCNNVETEENDVSPKISALIVIYHNRKRN